MDLEDELLKIKYQVIDDDLDLDDSIFKIYDLLSDNDKEYLFNNTMIENHFIPFTEIDSIVANKIKDNLSWRSLWMLFKDIDNTCCEFFMCFDSCVIRNVQKNDVLNLIKCLVEKIN